ncbi:MAG: signal peptidase I [Candidatus Bathyarchaeota archaeon]|nr:MAG: signal peptidase I [Candidatus Bathyarchaeota archaeon]
MSRKTCAILASFLAVYTVLALFRPGGLMAYALPSICWATLALVTLYITGGLKKIRSWTSNRITLMALLVAAFQIFILIDAGLINKFGKSPLSFTPDAIAINLTLVTATLLGTELSRAYLARNLIRKRPTLTLAVVTLLYTFTNVSTFALVNFKDPLIYSRFIGTGFLPVLTQNLLATYLALLSGPLASLAYCAPLQYFQWFSPILPDLPWGYESLIGVMTPTIGFIVINMATTQRDLRKAGIPTPRKPTPRFGRSRSSVKGWLAISLFLVLIVWSSTGLLGFYPSIVASGSMRPALDVGDVSIVVPIGPSQIQLGDIIQYSKEGKMTLHRVVDIQQAEGARLFITKGDDNPIPDSDPVFPAQIKGKLIFSLPKVGWISIYFKTAIAKIWTLLSTNIILTYMATSVIMLAASVYSFHTYKTRSHNCWRRKRGW